ncbi:MAG: hypothetical protein ACYC8V_09490 [Caulobacteraceae bacterium]
MSWLSQGIHDLEAFFSGLEAKNPALAAPAQAVGAQISAAVGPAEQLGVQLVNTAVDAVLAFVPGGANFDALANGFIDEVIAALTAKKASPPATTTG